MSRNRFVIMGVAVFLFAFFIAWATEQVSSYSTSLTVSEGDVAVSTVIGDLDFGAGFDIAEDPTGEANITLDYTEDLPILGTETAGNYAAGDAEAGNATGVACTDCIALTTETSGNYVTSVATTAPITGGAAGSEGATLTLALDQNAGTDVTADLEEEAHCAEHDGTGVACSGEALSWTASEISGTQTFGGATTLGTLSGNLTLSAAAGADVLIGDDVTLLYVDGGAGTFGFNAAATATELITIAGTAPTGVGQGMVFYPTLKPGSGGSSFGVNIAPTIQEFSSGVHALIAAFAVQVPTITAGNATVANTASFYVAGPPTATVSGANHSFWVDDGPSRFNGPLLIQNVSQNESPGTTTDGQIRIWEDADGGPVGRILAQVNSVTYQFNADAGVNFENRPATYADQKAYFAEQLAQWRADTPEELWYQQPWPDPETYQVADPDLNETLSAISGTQIRQGDAMILRVDRENLAEDGTVLSLHAIPSLLIEEIKAAKDKLERFLDMDQGTAAEGPACTEANRGHQYLLHGGPGVADTVAICIKKANDTYGWRTLP